MKVSRALVAASIFLAINFAIPASANLKGRGASISGDTIQQALRQAEEKLASESAKASPVVFIGSSLIIAPLWSTDVKHGYFYQDCMLHHQSKALEDRLKKDGIAAPVVSLATAGQFVSDTYLIIDKLIGGTNEKVGQGKAPLALIYGVAPRDFMDDTTGGLALTSVFDELVDLGDLPKVSRLFFSTFDERADFLLNRSVYLYRKRGRYQNKFEQAFEKAVARATRDKNASTAAAAVATNGSNDPLAGFLMGGNRNDIWAKSIDEYSRRYKFFNKQQFEKQKECFKAVVALCKQRGIKLYVVAMPITDDNRKLMPRELYGSYLQCLSETTRAAGVPFIDLQKGGDYQNDDFYDTVHLNGIGGERFLATMTDLVKDGAQTNTAVAATKKASSPTY
ncbi:MAG: hypothetical protein JSS86_04670 [Cyanobacteria bacterium SZAS LIN-2]|nr:hypothetical protein [Cyanobacteria bacterium SZAS LIN-2]